MPLYILGDILVSEFNFIPKFGKRALNKILFPWRGNNEGNRTSLTTCEVNMGLTVSSQPSEEVKMTNHNVTQSKKHSWRTVQSSCPCWCNTGALWLPGHTTLHLTLLYHQRVTVTSLLIYTHHQLFYDQTSTWHVCASTVIGQMRGQGQAVFPLKRLRRVAC